MTSPLMVHLRLATCSHFASVVGRHVVSRDVRTHAQLFRHGSFRHFHLELTKLLCNWANTIAQSAKMLSKAVELGSSFMALIEFQAMCCRGLLVQAFALSSNMWPRAMRQLLRLWKQLCILPDFWVGFLKAAARQVWLRQHPAQPLPLRMLSTRGT